MDYLNIIKDSGIVGAGGAGFPTHIKLNAKAEFYIVNGAECEPLLRVDQQLSAVFASELINGLKIGMQITEARQGIIALKEHYSEAIKALKPLIKKEKNIKIHLMESFYPAGDEQSLVFETIGRVVPEAGIPLQVGAVVNNVATLINISEAVNKNISVTHKWLTVAGEVAKPRTIRVPIGVSFKECIDFCGGTTIKDYKIISGGPMMGKIVPDTTLVDKRTGGILVLPAELGLIREKESDIRYSLLKSKSLCCQCRACTDQCPRYLLGHSDFQVHLLMRKVSYENVMDIEDFASAYLCCECGICTYNACPMGLSPAKVNTYLKGKLSKAGVKNPFNKKDCTPVYSNLLRRLPTSRLIQRLNLEKYDVVAPIYMTPLNTNMVRIPLQQHIGSKSTPIVKLSSQVKLGDKIAEPSGMGSVIHSSIDGKITDINDSYIEVKK